MNGEVKEYYGVPNLNSNPSHNDDPNALGKPIYVLRKDLGFRAWIIGLGL